MTRKRKHEDQGDLFAWGAGRSKVCTKAVQSLPTCSTEDKTAGAGNTSEPPDYGSAQPIALAPVVDFLARRDTLPRRILNPPPPFVYLDRQIARKHGIEPPAPIIPFAPRAGPPGHADSGGPLGRTG